ncbi:MAG: type II secretion system protein [Acidobacteriota bacterium]
MDLGDQRSGGRPSPDRTGLDDRGYIMVVLLISIAISAVWMTAALPSWRQQVIREREAELIFRGEAYARAIQLYRQKNNQNLPPNVDILISQKYLRKKYKDPITGKDFLVVGGVGLQPGGVGVPQTGSGAPSSGGFQSSGGLGAAGIIGVRSTSNDQSIRVYNNQQTYSQWAFDFTLEQLRSGQSLGPSSGGAAVGGRGGVSTTPGGGRGATPQQPGGGRGGPFSGPGTPQNNPGAGRQSVPPPMPGGGFGRGRG